MGWTCLVDLERLFVSPGWFAGREDMLGEINIKCRSVTLQCKRQMIMRELMSNGSYGH